MASPGGVARAVALPDAPADVGPAPTWLERRLDAVRAYWETLPAGRTTLTYAIRLETAGRFGAPPTRVEALYAPDVYGETPNAGLDVAP